MTNRLEIGDLRLDRSPQRPQCLRLSAQVLYPGRFSRAERLWFDLPDHLSDGIDTSGNPWLVCMLPLAMALGCPLGMALPVDPQLLGNANRLMEVWHSWYPELHPVLIEADPQKSTPAPKDLKTALFFSGGVDSFYSLLHGQGTGEEAIDDLILIHGFDIAVDNHRAFDRITHLAERAAVSTGTTLVKVATNARQTRFREADWGGLAFGPLLAGAGLILGNRYSRVLISAGLFPGRAQPHGSHPETDPLLSTQKTAICHLGYGVDRFEKLEFLRRFPEALGQLRVCFDTNSGENCGRCRKCLAVMAFLEIHGELADSPAFPGGELDLRRLSHVYLSGGLHQYRSLQAYAVAHGREDIADAIGSAFVRTDRLDRWLGLRWVRRARQRSLSHPHIRRATQWLRPTLWRIGLAVNRLLPW